MKKTIITVNSAKATITTALMCICLVFTACIGCNDTDIIKSSKKGNSFLEGENNPLAGTKWQLTAFVDVENNTTVLPGYYSYSITFEVNNSIVGWAGNIILGNYHIEDNSNKMFVLVGV